MIIKQIHIDAFGKLSDTDISLTDGLNIIEGKNESGKSTLGAFIKFIFYGIDSKERAKYFPWGKSTAGGYVKLSHKDKDYTVRRELILLQKGVKEDVCITDDETGAVVFKDAQPCDVFLGVNERVFSSTVFVGQINGAYVDGGKLSDAVENILFSADEVTNTSKALKKIDEMRVALLHKNKKGGLIYELGEKIADLEIKEADTRRANESVFELEDKLRQAKLKKEENTKNTEELSAKLEEYEAYSAIERKQRASELADEANEAKTRYEQLEVSLTKNGFLPDAAYVSSLYSLQNEINAQREELKEAEEEFKNAENELSSFLDEAQIIDKINAEGGKLYIEEDLALLKKQHKRLMTWGIICFVLIVLFPLGIALLMSAKKKKKLIEDFPKKFGCETQEQLDDILDGIGEREKEINRLRMKIEGAGTRCSDVRCKIAKTEQRTEELTDKYKPVSEITSTSVFEAAKEAEEAINALASARNEYEKKLFAAEALAKETENIDIAEMKSRIKGKLKLGEVEGFDPVEQKRRLTFLQGATESMNERIISLEKEFSALCATVKDPAVYADELSSLRPAYAEAVAEYKACVLAYESLENASKTLRDGVSPRLAKIAGGFMEKLSGGKYTSLGVDGEYGLTFTENGSSHPVSAFSAGTGDLAYLCLRFALTDVLYRDEKPPMIFDDTFARIDSERLANILATLASMGKMKWLQPIVFTCHDREETLTSSYGFVNVVKID